MAKKKRDTSVNKTAEVKNYAAANKGAKPQAIAEALKAKGVNASPGYVSSVLSNVKRKRKSPGRKKSAAASNGAVTVDSIIAAARFIKSAGGIDNAKAALRAAEAVAASV